MDIIHNGQASGGVASALLQSGFDVASLRPFISPVDGRSYIMTNRAGKSVPQLIGNSTATLRKDEWIELDTAVVMAAKERLQVVADLRTSGLTYNLANGMSKTVLETQAMSDISPATVSMDPARQSDSDRPEFDLTSLPLPVIHKDFHFNARQLAAGRNSGQGIDVLAAQLAARRVAEEAEKLVIGNGANVTYGGGTVYGLTNFPQRITVSGFHEPSVSGWTGATFVADVLQMRQAAVNSLHYGPYVLYVGKNWDQFLDVDYSTLKGDNTLRQRVQAIQGITKIQSLDYLPGWDLVLVQQSTDVLRLVLGMDVTTVQWETMGGMRLNFKVMAIMVPQLRADFNGNTGIVHAAIA